LKLKVRYRDPKTNQLQETVVEHDGGAAMLEGEARISAAAVVVERDLKSALGWTDVLVLHEVTDEPAAPPTIALPVEEADQAVDGIEVEQKRAKK
jgi:hypothetical protein